MQKNKVLISFDVEEFDLPRERGAEISLADGIKVSRAGLIKVLKMLERQKVRATFFCTGNFVEHEPEIISKIANAEHEIACHGVDHFVPKKSDIEESKRIVEKVLGKKVMGYRQPRMQAINYRQMKELGFLYDSSVNPALIPGRYNHLDTPRIAHKKNGVIEIPTSVATIFRIPLFWLSLHWFPLWLYVTLAKMAIKKTGYLATYFHPWEFADLSRFDCVPGYIKHNSNDKLVRRLEKLIIKLKKSGFEFQTYTAYAKIV